MGEKLSLKGIENEDDPIGREYAKGSFDVELFNGLLEGVFLQTQKPLGRDEKTAENKKEIHSRPQHGKCRVENVVHKKVLRWC